MWTAELLRVVSTERRPLGLTQLLCGQVTGVWFLLYLSLLFGTCRDDYDDDDDDNN